MIVPGPRFILIASSATMAMFGKPRSWMNLLTSPLSSVTLYFFKAHLAFMASSMAAIAKACVMTAFGRTRGTTRSSCDATEGLSSVASRCSRASSYMRQ